MAVIAPPSESMTKQAVETCIRSFLGNDNALDSAIGLNKSPIHRAVDSLTIVELLVQVETILGCKLPLTVIRRGGYYGVDDAISHLSPKIMTFWKDQH
jgi:acyl carrier protein